MQNRLRIVLFVTLAMCAVAQESTPPSTELQHAVHSEISRASAKLRWSSEAQAVQYRRDRDTVTADIIDAVDGFIERYAVATSEGIQKDLAYVLSDHRGDAEWTGPSFACEKQLTQERALVVSYSLVRGGPAVNESIVTVRGYRVVDGAYRLSDATGSDFDGYGMFVKELQSPEIDEIWLLVWGAQYGFNGNKTRVRVYVFNGSKFRTVWSPNDIFNAKVEVTKVGFAITRIDEERYYKLQQCPCYIHEDYVLMLDGPEKVGEYVVD